MKTVQVTIYTGSSCQSSGLLKAFFTGYRLQYEERNVEIDKECLEELVAKSKQFIVPVIEIGRRVVKGLDIKKIDELIQKSM